MPDKENPAPVDPTPTPQPAGDPPAGEPQPQLNAAELAAQLAEAQKKIREVNRESAERRKRLEQLEQAEAARAESEKTEAQKLADKLAAVEKREQESLAKANARLLRAEIMAKAAAQFTDPEDVYLALKDKLQVGDEGQVDGLDDELKALAKAKPHWVKRAGPNPLNPGNPNGAGQPGETEVEQRARVYGSGMNTFYPNAAREQGGGVFFPKDST